MILLAVFVTSLLKGEGGGGEEMSDALFKMI